ncbi:2'-5' RNA ligase family protein [Vitiosangium sp. GDMCC 1.1324]|uniref:2'-5' RNA ligase family protein n=1 Tax=Vitiosangium sp. (strain GDMCC 1.1324) TaxID=2138576 RepID=UPI00130D5F27|nr:2'-5' RNA ligase family protein [Vitiosangium sp. GDMCC 1.1324]
MRTLPCATDITLAAKQTNGTPPVLLSSNAAPMAHPAWTHRTAAVFIPPAEVWPPIQAIRRVHDRQVQRWMPHVTLLYPFAPRYELPGLLPSLEAACAALSPFEATLASFHVFQHRSDRSTFWLAPEPRESFQRIQSALQAAAPDYAHTSRFPGGFTPHLSVGQSGSAEEVAALLDRLRESWTPLVFPVAEVSIIAREGNRPFEVVRTLRLGR